MIFDIYGRFELELVLENNVWIAYRKSNGLRIPYPDLNFPPGIKEAELEQYLDDFFHEYATPERHIVKR